uniref:Metaxin glutathione S-transferase domain-containing protein n=1 Tax=Trypanosoma congolense (strain IL3000) TaxID=1068625 RepID=G0UV63_TRYCI|nr:conserved hypothetical protein [Trypanosoma congolense IL3000]
MSYEDPEELPSVTLHRYPVTLALPTADPHALAVECMLRLIGAHYKKQDAALPVTLEVPVAGGGDMATERRKGLASCLEFIESATHRDAEVITAALEPQALCVRALAELTLLPAFVYITHADSGLYNGAIRRAVEPKVASVWQRLRGSYCKDVLTGSSCRVRFTSVAAALREAERALRALEVVCSTNTASGNIFILGTGRACSIDALAYAAVSSFMHADFSDRHASGGVVAMQRWLRRECPALLKYVEQLRLLYFEEYSSFYTLRASGVASDCDAAQEAAADLFARGRWKVLTFTGVFSTLFFLSANIDVLLEIMLQYFEDPDDESRDDGENTEFY